MKQAPPPSIGLILLRAEWFNMVVALPELEQRLERDTAALLAAIPDGMDVKQVWTINSSESLSVCTQELRNSALDLVVLIFQVWAEDYYLQPLTQALTGQPLAVWCFQPSSQPPDPARFVDVLRYSGPVGTLEGLGTLHNLGVPFTFLVGVPGTPDLNKALMETARAGQAVQALRLARIGLLPARNEQMQSTFVDEFRLRADLGPQVEVLSVRQLEEAAAQLSISELEEFIRGLESKIPIREVKFETLFKAARASLGLTSLARTHQLDVLSLNDISPELHTALGLRPCLLSPREAESSRALYGLEGDLGAATAMLALRELSGSPLFFLEFWFWDEHENLLVGGHAGIQDPRVARPGELFISRDEEYCNTDLTEGACFQFACMPGKITLMQLRWSVSGWQALLCGGEVVDLPARLEGYPHAVIRPDLPVLDFFRQAAGAGTTQHWIMAYGDVREQIRIWCRMEKIALCEIGPQGQRGK